MYGPQREGKEAVKTAAGYIDRLCDDEFAGDTWCLDEWQIDGAFYDEQDHERIFNYGENRPQAHILTILDERTTCIIDYLVTWQVSLEDAVFALAERTIRQHFLPRRVVSARAARFRALVRGHMVLCSEDLVKKLAVPLGALRCHGVCGGN
jgi:transposase InsO family protein